MHSLRSALYLQAAVTALFGLAKGGSGTWTFATMVVAAGAVFIGSALQPTPGMRNAALGYEGLAVAFGVVGLVADHYVPGTILAVGLGIQLLGANAALAFTGTPAPTLQVFGAPLPVPPPPPVVPEQPVASPVLPPPLALPAPAPAVPAQPEAPVQLEAPVQVAPVIAAPRSAMPSMTILPSR